MARTRRDREMEISDGPQDEIEAADAAAERAQQRRKERARLDRASDVDRDRGAERDADEGDQAAPRRRMVIESDEE